jgi:hypothetical protein
LWEASHGAYLSQFGKHHQDAPTAGGAIVTIREAAKTALLAQDACNLSGVLASFHTIVFEVIWPEARKLGKGTVYVNTHPIVTLFLSKLTDLNRSGCYCTDAGEAYGRATCACEALANGQEVQS